MKTINIAHLYYDLMNLNGEAGNVMALKSHFESQGLKVNITLLTIGDEINFNKYDIYYMGSGSKENKLIVIEDILKYKKDIESSIKNNKYFIVTGNALDLFGKFIEEEKGHKIKCLEIFKYHTKEIDPEESIVGEQIFKSNFINENIIGFQNRQNIMINEDDNNLFTVINGAGYQKGSNEEGYLFNNFYGTYLLGPLLIRNPCFTDYLVEKILRENKLPYKANHNALDYITYNEFINNKKQD